MIEVRSLKISEIAQKLPRIESHMPHRTPEEHQEAVKRADAMRKLRSNIVHDDPNEINLALSEQAMEHHRKLKKGLPVEKTLVVFNKPVLKLPTEYTPL